jgi:hypothetical protein
VLAGFDWCQHCAAPRKWPIPTAIAPKEKHRRHAAQHPAGSNAQLHAHFSANKLCPRYCPNWLKLSQRVIFFNHLELFIRWLVEVVAQKQKTENQAVAKAMAAVAAVVATA